MDCPRCTCHTLQYFVVVQNHPQQRPLIAVVAVVAVVDVVDVVDVVVVVRERE